MRRHRCPPVWVPYLVALDLTGFQFLVSTWLPSSAAAWTWTSCPAAPPRARRCPSCSSRQVAVIWAFCNVSATWLMAPRARPCPSCLNRQVCFACPDLPCKHDLASARAVQLCQRPASRLHGQVLLRGALYGGCTLQSVVGTFLPPLSPLACSRRRGQACRTPVWWCARQG